MPTYFADTWFLIAELDVHDGSHFASKRIRERIRGGRLITHEGVLTELLAFFADNGAHIRSRVVAEVRNLLRGGAVVPASSDLFLRALALYAARPDKEYSLTDCMSMVVMRDRGIEYVLTNDHHFRQEGFTVLAE